MSKSDEETNKELITSNEVVSSTTGEVRLNTDNMPSDRFPSIIDRRVDMTEPGLLWKRPLPASGLPYTF